MTVITENGYTTRTHLDPEPQVPTSVSPLFVDSFPVEREDEWWARFEPADRLIQGRTYLLLKRVMDLVIVILALPITLPLLLLCAILIKLDSPDGPIFFTQDRTGKGGQRFKMVKFRTMVANAEDLKNELAHLNELQWPDFKISNDPRVTTIGRLLRKTSLDELPQLINIMRGDMSLVGPRPTSFSAYTYALWHTERLDVMPGLTGLWQITGRGTMEFDDRVRLDVAYIEHRCLWLDIQILIRTFLAIIQQRGAH